MASGYRWLNEPASWKGGDRDLSLKTDGNTDFWRETFYGFVRDSGHAYLRPVPAISQHRRRSSVDMSSSTIRPV